MIGSRAKGAARLAKGLRQLSGKAKVREGCVGALPVPRGSL